MAWGERSSLVLPLGFRDPLCMHCSAAVWCFSPLAAAALLASAAAGLVAPCWNFWYLAIACFYNVQQCSRFPFLAKTGSGGFWWILMDSDGIWWNVVDSDVFRWMQMYSDGSCWIVDSDGFWWILVDSDGF